MFVRYSLTMLNQTDCFIDRGSVVEGKLSTKGNVQIEGTFMGEASSQEAVTIAESGKLQGSIKASNVVIKGTIEGAIESSDKVRLARSSRCSCDIVSTVLAVEEGAQIKGRFVIMPNASAKDMPQGTVEALADVELAPAPQPQIPPKAAQAITLSVVIPEAAKVDLIGTFNQWDETNPIPMNPTDQGAWEAKLELESGSYQYLLLVDGVKQTDPNNPDKAPNEHGSENSVLTVKDE